jgi:hypothetical protein
MAIPELLDILEIRGSIVTIDTMGTQTAIAANIIEKEAGYILAVKTIKRDSWKKLRLPASSISSPASDTTQTETGHYPKECVNGKLQIKTICRFLFKYNFVKKREE